MRAGALRKGVIGVGMKIEEICGERLETWKQRLVKENATPVVLLAVGHGDLGGTLVVCTLDDFTNEAVRDFLRGALNQVEEDLKGGI